jgi:HK97 family phage major capsid protein
MNDTVAARANHERLEDFYGVLRAGMAQGDLAQGAHAYAMARPHSPFAKAWQTRSAVEPGTLDGWGSPLAPLRPAINTFLQILRPATVLGQMTGFRPASFRTRLPRQTAASSVGWTAEGSARAVTTLSMDAVQFEHSVVEGITVFSKELARFSDPAAQGIVERDLTSSASSFLDDAFLDPTRAAVDEAPASITNGVTPIQATGATAAALKTDLGALFDDVISRGSVLTRPYLVMTKARAAKIAMLGESWTDGLGVTGGTLAGVPVITTTASGLTGTNSPTQDRIVLVDAAEVLFADDGATFDISTQADVQLSTTPDSPATASTVWTSLWQRDLVGVLCRRRIRWEPVRDGAAGYIDGAEYGG